MRKKLNQSGAVSLLSVLIFSLIITVITTAYIASVVSQQKNALSYDQGTRAYYAAESGVQDTVRALRANPARLDTDKTACDINLWDDSNTDGIIGASADYGMRYTCQLVTPTPPKVEGSVEPGGARNATVRLQLKDANQAGPYTLVVRWSRPGLGGQVLYPTNRTGSQQKLTGRYPQWNQGGDSTKPLHAMLRLGVITHPSTGPLNRSIIRQNALFLNPTTSDEAPTLSNPGDLTTQQEQLITNAACQVSDPSSNNYFCQSEITLGSGYDLRNQTLYIRIGSVYRATNFSLSMENAAGTPLDFEDTEAIIDITAKSGNNVFRRVKQTVPIGGYYEDNQPDAALVAGEGICKLLSLGTTSASYSNGCD